MRSEPETRNVGCCGRVGNQFDGNGIQPTASRASRSTPQCRLGYFTKVEGYPNEVPGPDPREGAPLNTTFQRKVFGFTFHAATRFRRLPTRIGGLSKPFRLAGAQLLQPLAKLR